MQDTMDSEYLLFAGSSHQTLVKEIISYAGFRQGKIAIKDFPDGEIDIEILECVRNYDVFILQTVALQPNHFLMELLIIIEALKRASAKSINVVIPYFGYCRQDRKTELLVPITARLVANLLEAAGATRALTMDLHAPQVQGFFNIPLDEIRATPAFLDALLRLNFNHYVVVTPDIGSVKLASRFAKMTGTDYVIIDKARVSATEVSVHRVYGDVKDKNILLIDDICSTAATLVAAAQACQENGAKRMIALITHGLFVDQAIEKIEASPIEFLLVANTIPLSPKALACKKLVSVSVAGLFAQAMLYMVKGESITVPSHKTAV